MEAFWKISKKRDKSDQRLFLRWAMQKKYGLNVESGAIYTYKTVLAAVEMWMYGSLKL